MTSHDTPAALDPLDATADLVLEAAQRWRTGKREWSDADRQLEHRLWLELLDLYDVRHRPTASHDDVVHACCRLVAVAEIHDELLDRVWPLRAAMRALQSQLVSAA